MQALSILRLFTPQSLTNSGNALGCMERKQISTGGHSSNMTPQDCLITLGTSLRDLFQDNTMAFPLLGPKPSQLKSVAQKLSHNKNVHKKG